MTPKRAPQAIKDFCRHALNKALNEGRVTRPDACEKCGTPPAGTGGAGLQAHHFDYDRPLEVIWLCKKCHMALHHAAKNQGRPDQKDNSTGIYKILLRQNLLKFIDRPVILETHGGEGVIFAACYGSAATGPVFEKNPEKAEILARQRPGWLVYETDCMAALSARCGNGLGINFLDVDPYGDPWPVIRAFFDAGYDLPDTLAVAVNDGLRQKVKQHAGWAVRSMRPAVEQFGNADLYANYLEVCQALMAQISGPWGYEIAQWTGYYCGHAKNHDPLCCCFAPVGFQIFFDIKGFLALPEQVFRGVQEFRPVNFLGPGVIIELSHLVKIHKLIGFFDQPVDRRRIQHRLKADPGFQARLVGNGQGLEAFIRQRRPGFPGQ